MRAARPTVLAVPPRFVLLAQIPGRVGAEAVPGVIAAEGVDFADDVAAVSILTSGQPRGLEARAFSRARLWGDAEVQGFIGTDVVPELLAAEGIKPADGVATLAVLTAWGVVGLEARTAARTQRARAPTRRAVQAGRGRRSCRCRRSRKAPGRSMIQGVQGGR